MLYAIIDWARAADSYGKCQIGQQDDNRKSRGCTDSSNDNKKNNSAVMCITYAVNERAMSDI